MSKSTEDMAVTYLEQRGYTVLPPKPVPPPPDGDRDGDTYEVEFDRERLNAQARRVYDVMADGYWRTLSQISRATGDPEASVSARLRDFRKRKFGSLTVQARRVPFEDGLWEYRLGPSQDET